MTYTDHVLPVQALRRWVRVPVPIVVENIDTNATDSDEGSDLMGTVVILDQGNEFSCVIEGKWRNLRLSLLQNMFGDEIALT